MSRAIPWILVLAVACGPSGDAPQPDAAARDAAVEPGPGRVVIRMLDDMTFDPPHAVAHVGDTIVWVNDGRLPHTATADPRAARNPASVSLPAGARPWDSGSVAGGGTFRVAAEVPGAYAYVCTLHEMAGMKGTLEVRP
ncbi:MAG: plastocyanin/azurin family copper-binding protein [Gemmatimonadota bacterium]|nr:plastocyanin/azurin family copper-binding protein [Gemmatimonadota bacterium]